MPDIFGNPTASEAIATIKTNRAISDAKVRKSGIPSNEKAGKIAVMSHSVTAAENTANQLTESFPDFEVIESTMVQLKAADGTLRAATPVVTVAGNVVTIADTTMITGDIYTITIKGIKS